MVKKAITFTSDPGHELPHLKTTPPPAGDNAPPPDPFEVRVKAIDDLYGEAKLWMDGQPVADQDMADGVANLIKLLRKERDGAEEDKKAETRPHLDIVNAIRGKWKPYETKCERAIDSCKRALLPWSQKLRDEQEMIRRAAEQAAAIAIAKRQQAEATANPVVLEEMEAVAEMQAVEMDARQTLDQARKLNPGSGSKELGRAVSIRQKPVPVIIDRKACMTHYWQTRKEEVCQFLLTLAIEDIRLKRPCPPGIRIDMVDTIA